MTIGQRAWLTRILLLALVLALTPSAVAAAPVGQEQQGAISFDDPLGVSGTLDANSAAHLYTFPCTENGMGSLVAETTGGDLRTQVAVASVDGAWSVAGADVSGSSGVNAAEAFIMPASGPCVATVSRVGEGSGTYNVKLWHGFGSLAVLDPFDAVETPPALDWENYSADTMRIELGPSRMEIHVFAEQLVGLQFPEDTLSLADLYAQVEVQVPDAPSYFEYGLALRLDLSQGQSLYYLVLFSKDNDYSVYYVAQGEWTALQDWKVSPLIDTSLPSQRIGVALRGSTFRVYFNDQFIGQVEDPNNLASSGTISLAAATGTNQSDSVSVYFDNLLITQPLTKQTSLPFGGLGQTTEPTPTRSPLGGLGQLLGGSSTPTPAPQPTATPKPSALIPETIAVQPNDPPEAAVETLRAAGLVPAGGTLGLTVPTSYGDTSGANWSSYPLGQGRTFRNFVLSFNARLVATGPGSGCGMYFRESGGANSDAIVFADGFALLGEWTSAGELTDASVIEKFEAVRPGQGSFNHVVVVAQDQTVTMYVNGRLFATAQFEARTGGVALEMYVEPDDAGNTVETYCQLNNIWLWQY